MAIPSKRIVCIGGGTGQVPILKSLKGKKGISVYSIVCMTDSGGSSGRLRRRLGILPPGDLLKSLLALSGWGSYFHTFCTHRITGLPYNALNGHSIGNLIVAFFLYISPISIALRILHILFFVRGTVLPVTEENTNLFIQTKKGVIESEDIIDTTEIGKVERIYLKPQRIAYDLALRCIYKADTIILSPGDLYTTSLPTLILEDMSGAIIKSSAQKIYMANLSNKQKHAPNFSIDSYLEEIRKFTGISFNVALYNHTPPDSLIFENYLKEDQSFITKPSTMVPSVGADLIHNAVYKPVSGDVVKRSYLRHDAEKVYAALSKIFESRELIRCFVFDFDRTIGNVWKYEFEKEVYPIYQDASFLTRVVPHYVSIVTTGDYTLQMSKILKSRIQVDDILIAKTQKENVKKIRRILKKYGAPIVFVDDNPKVLDIIRQAFSENQVILYHLVRDDAKYGESDFSYRVLHSLHSISECMKKQRVSRDDIRMELKN